MISKLPDQTRDRRPHPVNERSISLPKSVRQQAKRSSAIVAADIMTTEGETERRGESERRRGSEVRNDERRDDRREKREALASTSERINDPRLADKPSVVCVCVSCVTRVCVCVCVGNACASRDERLG